MVASNSIASALELTATPSICGTLSWPGYRWRGGVTPVSTPERRLAMWAHMVGSSRPPSASTATTARAVVSLSCSPATPPSSLGRRIVATDAPP
jgi:hypothetical protein